MRGGVVSSQGEADLPLCPLSTSQSNSLARKSVHASVNNAARKKKAERVKTCSRTRNEERAGAVLFFVESAERRERGLMTTAYPWPESHLEPDEAMFIWLLKSKRSRLSFVLLRKESALRHLI
jgi:hypothetical protein